MSTPQPSKPVSQRVRRLFITVHLWMGLILGAWFALIGITGSVLAWRAELTSFELARRFALQQPAPGASGIGLTGAVEAMRRAYPEMTDRELQTVTLPNRRMPFYAFSRGQNRATQETIMVDPYTARVHPPVRLRLLTVGTITQLHQRLLTGFRGWVVNGVLTVLALPLLLTGLYLWWPATVKMLKQRLSWKRGVSLNRSLYDLHNIMGAYLYVVLFVATLTGALLVGHHLVEDGWQGFRESWASNGQPSPQAARQPGAPAGDARGSRASAVPGQGMGAAPGRAPGGAPGGRRGGRRRRGADELPTVIATATRLTGDQVIQAAQALMPGYEVTRIVRPLRGDQAFQVTYGRATGFFTSETLFVDPYTGRRLEGAAVLGPRPEPFEQVTRALHFGEFGGLTTKLLYTASGVTPLGLFITGATLWWRKRRRRARPAAEPDAAPTRDVEEVLEPVGVK